MDENLLNELSNGMYSLVKSNAIMPGTISKVDGVIVYEPIETIEEYINLLKEGKKLIGYHTHSMGRGIFVVNEDGSIINYKGVDSHLKQEESYPVLFTKRASEHGKKGDAYEVTKMPSYGVFISADRLSTEFRIQGASEIQNLINEKDKIDSLRALDIDHLMKLESDGEVIPFTDEFCEKYQLPRRVPLTKEYVDELKKEEKNYTVYVLDYMEKHGMDTSYRYELMSEYFDENFLLDKDIVPDENFDAAIKHHDSVYQLGGAFGQMARKLDGPFRVLDIEYLLTKPDRSEKDIKEIDSIITYLENKYDNYLIEYAKWSARNVAGLMNHEHVYHNYMHRQDFSLTGELCDDAFDDISKELSELKQIDPTNANFKEYYYKKIQYIFQFYYLGSNLQVLENAYSLTGRKIPDNLTEIFITEFINNIKNTKNFSREEIVKSIYTFSDFGVIMNGTYKDLFEPYSDFIMDLNEDFKKEVNKIKGETEPKL